MREMDGVERAVLDRVLSVEFDGVAALREQARHIVGVEANCTCGCPSITPIVDRSAAGPAQLPWTKLPAELWEGDRPNGVVRTVLAFVDVDGYLANLECVYYDEPLDEWPDPQTCEVVLLTADP